jgi:hypothetical protein
MCCQATTRAGIDCVVEIEEGVSGWKEWLRVDVAAEGSWCPFLLYPMCFAFVLLVLLLRCTLLSPEWHSSPCSWLAFS